MKKDTKPCDGTCENAKNKKKGFYVCNCPQEVNQCDGCQRGLKITNGNHYGNSKNGDRIIMGCTKDRYSQPQKQEKERIESFVKSGSRQNLINFIEKFPMHYVDVIDSAYVAGLDDARRSTPEHSRKQEKCYSCQGTGTYSQIHGEKGAEDFGGEGYENKPSIHEYPCKECNGTGLKSAPVSPVEERKCHECENQATKRLYPTGKYVCDIHAGLNEEEYELMNKIYPPPTPDLKEKDWEKIIREKVDYDEAELGCEWSLNELIAFIRSAIASEREEFKRTLNSGRKMYELGRQEERDRIIKKAREYMPMFQRMFSGEPAEGGLTNKEVEEEIEIFLSALSNPK